MRCFPALILLFCIFCPGCNVINRFAEFPDERLEQLTNKRLKGEFRIDIRDTSVCIFNAQDSLKMNGGDLLFDSYVQFDKRKKQLVIYLNPETRKVIKNGNGFLSTSDAYILQFSRKQSQRTLRRAAYAFDNVFAHLHLAYASHLNK